MYEANLNLYHPPMATTQVAQLHRIILANEPRLLREMLGHVFDGTPGLQVVAIVENPVQLAAVVGQEKVHWLVVTLESGDGLAPTYLTNDEPPSLLAISEDGRQVEVQRTTPDGNQEAYKLYDISLESLLSILR